MTVTKNSKTIRIHEDFVDLVNKHVLEQKVLKREYAVYCTSKALIEDIIMDYFKEQFEFIGGETQKFILDHNLLDLQ